MPSFTRSVETVKGQRFQNLNRTFLKILSCSSVHGINMRLHMHAAEFATDASSRQTHAFTDLPLITGSSFLIFPRSRILSSP